MIGSHIANATRSHGWETYGVARNSSSSRIAAINDNSIVRCDILDRDLLEATFKKIQPDVVFHMAAQAFNGISWDTEESTHLTNYQGTVNVLRAVRMHAPNAKVMLACSSAEYGDVSLSDCPLVEDRALHPVSPYGVSKVATESLGYQYFSNFGIQVYLPRLFIHVGTGHPPATAIQTFARQLALMSKGKLSPIMKVGNLSSARDFIDVRDGVEGMMLLLKYGSPGDPVNICTGTSYTISEILSMLIDISGLKVEVKEDSSLLRLSDEPLLLGDASKLMSLGWSQKYSIQETLKEVFNDWVKRVD